ncbi:MAG: hypothetical protein JW941_07120 [Candidatus Coatesbacteria bacterium]|nr:hypothetical protein [Candidatus Coatesbacteria bacterium]
MGMEYVPDHPRDTAQSQLERRAKRQKILGLMDVGKSPVLRAFAEFSVARDALSKLRRRDGNDDLRAFISDRLLEAGKQPDDWLHYAELFEAEYILATRCDSENPERQSWLDAAWEAAQRCMEMNPSSACVAEFIRNCRPIEKGFARRVLRKLELESPLDEYPAVRQYSLACLYRAINDLHNASKAIEDAYRLCPEDLLIASFAKRVRTAIGDYDGALEILRAQEREISENAYSEGDPFLAASQSLHIVELCIKAGQRDEALDRLKRVWSSLSAVDCVEHSPQNHLVNSCATLLGLLSFSEGDLSAALHWFRASLLPTSRGLRHKGYDLRLVGRLICIHSAKEACLEYLRLATKVGPAKTRREAELFRRILSDVGDGPAH